MISSSDYILVKNLHLGLYFDWGGGAALKILTNNEISLLAFQNEQVFSLLNFINRSINDKKFVKPRMDSKKMKGITNSQPKIVKADFEKLDNTKIVSKWVWNVFNDHVKVIFITQTGAELRLLFSIEILYLLKHYLDEIFERKELVDLTEFRNKDSHEMLDEINSLKGNKLLNMFESFENSISVFDTNYKHLIDHLQKYTGKIDNPDFYSWSRRYNQTIFLRESLRLLHNFVASCKSLIDHTRVFNRKYFECPDFHDSCRKKIKSKFTNDPLSNFVQILREYVQHYSLPGISIQFSFGGDGATAEVSLVKEDLLKFNRWNPQAKEFISKKDDSINLVEILREYHQKTVDFYYWIREQRNKLYWTDFRELDLKRRAYFAKESSSVVGKIKSQIENSNVFTHKSILDLFSSVLSPSEIFELQEYEGDWKNWIEKAVELSSARYFIDEELKLNLLKVKIEDK